MATARATIRGIPRRPSLWGHDKSGPPATGRHRDRSGLSRRRSGVAAANWSAWAPASPAWLTTPDARRRGDLWMAVDLLTLALHMCRANALAVLRGRATPAGAAPTTWPQTCSPADSSRTSCTGTSTRTAEPAHPCRGPTAEPAFDALRAEPADSLISRGGPEATNGGDVPPVGVARGRAEVLRIGL